MNNVLMSGISSFARKSVFELRKYSPEILTGVGIAAIGAGTVLACKATLEAHEIVESTNHEFDIIEEAHETDPKRFPMKKVHTAKVEQIIQAGLKFTKLYGPSILCLAGGIAAILGGHGILRRRNAALAVAYTGLSESFLQYRKRVAKMLGDDADKSFLYDYKVQDIVETNEDGDTEIVEKDAKVVDPETVSQLPYSFCFDESNPNYSSSRGANLFFLRNHQNWLNNKLAADGYLTLNDALTDLGFKPTNIGALVGWLYVPSDHTRDNYVSFGMDEVLGGNENPSPEQREAKLSFLYGPEKSIWLNFNVDGPIYKEFDTKYGK